MTHRFQYALPRRRILAVLAVVSLAAAIGLGFYGRSLFRQVEERFAGRRWSVPSRVYSDVTCSIPVWPSIAPHCCASCIG
jgi:predicted membrane protein